MLKEGYKEVEGKFYNAKGEEVSAEEATETTPAPAAPAPTPAAPATDAPEGTEEAKALVSTVQDLVKAEGARIRAELSQPVRKDINLNPGATVVAAQDRIGKEEKFKQFVLNVRNNDFVSLKAAGNTTSLGDVIPPTEFISEVFRLEEEYGVAERDADVRRTDRTSITMILGDDDIQVTNVAEAGVKPSKKLAYLPFELTFKKWAGILPLTDELLEDSAINLWADATQRFARAFARKADELVFTDSASGIVNEEGVNDIEVYSINQLTADHLNLAMYGVPTGSMANGKFYFHRTILGFLQRLKDSDGRYILATGPNGPVSGTLWNRPYELTEVLPSYDATDSGDEFIVFGDLKYTVLGMRTQMKIDMSNSAVVGDPDGGSDLNSWTQDLTSMRAVKRMNAKVKFPEAYSVIRATRPVS